MPDPRPLRPNDPREAGGFRLTARIGEGSQGSVFLGESGTGQQVAVKLLHADFGRDARARTGFERELAAARRVAPFCTAPVLAAEADGDTPYIVSEYIDGPSLRDLVSERGVFTAADLTRLAIGTATALAAIHDAGVVHRDFKPANVLLAADGPKVIDFGIARPLDATSATMTGAVGTPAYMAPEQVAGTTGGAPLDMFAWGCTMAFAANGVPPFGHDSVPAIMQRILYGEPDLGALTGDLRDLAASCLAKDPAARPTALQVLQRLLAAGPDANLLAEGTSAAALPVAPPPPPPAVPPSPAGASPFAPPDSAGSQFASPVSAGSAFSPPDGAQPPFAPPDGAGPAEMFPPAVPPPPQPPPQPSPQLPPPREFPYSTRPSASGRSGRPLLIAAAAVAVVLLGAGGVVAAVLFRDGGKPGTEGGTPVAQSGPATAATTTAPGLNGCSYKPVTDGRVKDVGTPPVSSALPTGATVKTNLGTLELELDAEKAPCAVNSLAHLANQQFYDNTTCHRLTTNPTLKVLQCGDPSGTGTGGPGYEFANENTTGVRYIRGTVAMANAGPGTNGSQFFILYEDAPDLPADYPVIGRVTSGMEAVDKVAGAGVATGGDDGEPKQKITITEFRTLAG
ncbi:peptidylprolyl isomerase [Spirillospora sp. NPDC048819]|uniref:protein kinase domain-containing protein n=1 Tax=Spirillospora sp. NPDC048819 TaxID=3155268 RepID=UPI0033ED29DC